jgi:uncharacterized tellurite resistance protein B-like protein
MPHEPREQQLLRWLRPVRRRLAAIRLVRRAAAGLLAGSCAALLPLAAARFLPLPGAPLLAAFTALAGLAAGAALALRPRIDDRTAARVMDGAGTDDAIVTALDMLHLDTPVARLQRADAEAAAARYAAGLGERLPWPRGRERRRYLAGLAAVWTLAAVLLLLPNPMEERLAAREALGGEIGRIGRALEELEQSGVLKDQERKALTGPLDRLREQALRMKPDELRAEWEAAGREIARLAAELKEEQQALRAWAQELQRTSGLEALGRALERGDRRSLADELEQTGSLFARLDPEQREALAERLRELASAAPEAFADSLRDALERAAEALEDGQAEAAADAMRQALEDALSEADLQALAEQAVAALASAGSRLGLGSGSGSGGGWNGIADSLEGDPGGGAGSPEGGQSGADGPPSGGSGPGRGQVGDGSAGPGQNRGGSGLGGSSSGGAAGSGSGSGGSGGAGSQGAGAGAGGSGGGFGSGGGAGRGSGSGAGLGSGGRTLITTPRIYDGEGNVITDGGPTSGGTATEGGRSPVVDGGVLSYEEVYASYEADARRAISGGTLPPALRERVKNYFDEIQPDR